MVMRKLRNIAKAIEKDRDALNNAGQVVIMGGAYFKQYADWNVMCDPEAAALLFRHTPNLVCMGADVTHRLNIGEENSRYLLSLENADPAAAYVSRLYRLWVGDSRCCAVLHDPLAILYTAEPDICRLEEAEVEVITEGPARGLTLNVNAYGKKIRNPYYRTSAPPGRARVAADVRQKYVIDRFMREFR
jgi:inosine-uridine nucleoside N-ribohydrolase